MAMAVNTGLIRFKPPTFRATRSLLFEEAIADSQAQHRGTIVKDPARSGKC
jgi:hypothetical protein